MGIVYVTLPPAISRDREKVSRIWSVVLHDMREDIWFNLNEGHRTLARQAQLVAEKGVWSPSNPTGAARPSPFAPHIRTGRFDHAIDVDADQDVFAWLARNQLYPARTVPGESWHIECPAWALLAYYAKHKPKPSPLRFVGKVRRKASETLLRRRRARKAQAATGRGPKWRRLNAGVKRSYRQVATYAKRAKSPRVKRILNRVLRDRDGRL
jgi:hypothetical protein